MRKLAFALILIPSVAFAQAVGQYDLPNPKLTPGVANPKVTPANIKTTICVTGWTKTIRPTVTYTNSLKVSQIKNYKFPDGSGFADTTLTSYEEDHLISLEIGGHPSDPNNLWPEIYNSVWGAKIKDHLENVLKAKVCSGALNLVAAQKCISINWIDCYHQHIGPQPQ